MVIRTRTAQALYFNSGERTIFGWLHAPPVAAKARIGLLICKPFGYEAICSHRSIRSFAENTAAIGIPSLRFDYLGTGDSSDIDADEDQLEVWTQDVTVAAEELRRLSGVDHVCVLGVRLGALLAVRAALRSTLVQSLVLIAPIISGRRYLAELRTTRLAASLTLAGDHGRRDPKDNSMEVSGFTVSPATVDALKQTELTDLGAPPAPDMLILDNASFPIANEWSRRLEGLGARIDYQTLPGLVAMTMTAPQFATVPSQMIDATCRWLKQMDGKLSDQAPATDREVRAGSTLSFLTLPGTKQPHDAAPREHPLFLSSDQVLFGILTEPCKSEKRRRGVILLNAGADYHIGASRIYVELARSWASRGYFVLRMDLAGLGDSGTRPGREPNNVFPPDAVEDIRAAVEFLVTRYGIRNLTLAGLCSGAYHALRAAVAALPVHLILLINPPNFFWKEGRNPQNFFWDEWMTVNDLQRAELQRGQYRLQLRSLAAWKKLITGNADVGHIFNIYLHRLFMHTETAVRNLARYLRIPLPRDLGRELEQVGARGVNVVFAFARGEPGLDLLKVQGGNGLKRLGRRCRIHIIDDADHIFSRKSARAAMERIISAELFSKAR